jgi:PAS domain S-box-containing protein
MIPDNEKQASPLDTTSLKLSDRNREFILSPVRLMTTLLLCVFIVETIVMIVLESKEPVGWKETLIDSSILTTALFVVLYFSLFKPLVGLIKDYMRNKNELEIHQKHLEQVILDCALSEAALQETKAILQAAMDQSPAGIAIANAPDGSLRYVNDAGLFIRGAKSDVLVDGVSIEQYVERWQLFGLDGEPLKPEETPLACAILTGETCSREMIIRRDRDDDRIVIVNAAPIKNETGTVVAAVAVFLDITERIRVEKELQESETKFRALFETAKDGIVVISSHGEIVSMNRAFVEMHGYTEAEALTMKLADFDTPESSRLAPARMQQVLAGEAMSFEVEHYCKDGHTIPLEVSANRLTIGGKSFVLGFVRDISERLRVEQELKEYQDHLEQMVRERSRDLEETSHRLKKENEEHVKAQAALLESEERFRQIFEQSEDAIVLIYPTDNAIIDVNPTAERIFRKTRAEMLGNGLSSLCGGDGYRQLKSALEQITSDGLQGRIERLECSITPDYQRILSFRGKLINLQGSGLVYSTFRDITSRIRLEEQAQEIQARLIQANRMTSLGTMVSSVAHEINNPNNFLLMNAGIIKRAWDDIAPVIEEHFQSSGDFAVAQSMWSDARTFLPDAIEGLQQGALRISDIVGNLKNFGRDDRFSSESVADVNAVVQLSASILSHLISSSTRKFKLELAEGLPLARGSARQLEQVVINLIQNALMALPDKEHAVTVSTGVDPDSSDHVLIRVSDEGIGIPSEISARIMEPFFTTRLERGGTGLGLAICSTIVKEHGGGIEFSTEPGRGTTFTVRLYRAASADKDTKNSEVTHVKN